MIVEPKAVWRDPDRVWVWQREGLYVECVCVHPPSAEGRNVTLRIPPELADGMLRALRDYGVERRRL